MYPIWLSEWSVVTKSSFRLSDLICRWHELRRTRSWGALVNGHIRGSIGVRQKWQKILYNPSNLASEFTIHFKMSRTFDLSLTVRTWVSLRVTRWLLCMRKQCVFVYLHTWNPPKWKLPILSHSSSIRGWWPDLSRYHTSSNAYAPCNDVSHLIYQCETWTHILSLHQFATRMIICNRRQIDVFIRHE